MRITFLLVCLLFLNLKINSQVDEHLTSNNWYFSESDTLFFSQKRIKANNIKQVKEYRTDKKYVDSAQIMSEYYFDTSGALIEAKSFDIYGTGSVSKFKIAPNGKMSENWYADKNGVLNKTYENIYNGNKLIKQTSFFGQNYAPSKTYTYTANNLVSSIQHFGPTGTKEIVTEFTYDSLNQLVSEVTKKTNDSVAYSYFHKYDELGRRYFTEYKEHAFGWKQTIDYSKSSLNCSVKQIYAGDKLNSVVTKKTNELGLITELIYDARTRIKRRKKTNKFCGYSGPPRFQKWTYEYDLKGNLISEKTYYSPNKVSQCIIYTLDNKGNLIKKEVFAGSKKDSEWCYTYN